MKLYGCGYDNKRDFNNCVTIDDKNAIVLVGKCGCSTIASIYLDKIGIKHDFNKYEKFNNWEDIKKSTVKLTDIDRSKYKIIAIIRDPKERLMSAKNTVDFFSTNKNFLKNVKYTFLFLEEKYIDSHLLPQCKFYDYQKIDEFVWLHDLEKWLKSKGIENRIVNARKIKENFYEIPYDVIKLYNDDYKMLDEIKNKIWKP